MPKCAARFLDLLAKLAPAFEPRACGKGSHPTPSLGNADRLNFGHRARVRAALVGVAEGVGLPSAMPECASRE
jgi:hypothetical protein